MKDSVKVIFDGLIERYPVLEGQRDAIEAAYEMLKTCYENGGKLLTAGNGGSYADSEHIVGELTKGFKKERPLAEEYKRALIDADPVLGAILSEKLDSGLRAMCLAGHQGLNTAYSNDIDPMFCFAQQLNVYGDAGDVFLAISTSGNSTNILNCLPVAKAKGISILALTGKGGGKLALKADCAVVVPDDETYRIQELHLPIYHALCLMLEETFF